MCGVQAAGPSDMGTAGACLGVAASAGPRERPGGAEGAAPRGSGSRSPTRHAAQDAPRTQPVAAPTHFFPSCAWRCTSCSPSTAWWKSNTAGGNRPESEPHPLPPQTLLSPHRPPAPHRPYCPPPQTPLPSTGPAVPPQAPLPPQALLPPHRSHCPPQAPLPPPTDSAVPPQTPLPPHRYHCPPQALLHPRPRCTPTAPASMGRWWRPV